MTLRLPDDAAVWAQTWRDRITESDEFAEAAAEFTATFLFEIRPDDSYDGNPVRFRAVIADGGCSEIELLEPDTEPAYDFALRGPYTEWNALLTDDIDVSDAVMDGAFDLAGNTMALLKRKDAIAEMVTAARSIDTEFPPQD
jgi:putative sterol carrier protein